MKRINTYFFAAMILLLISQGPLNKALWGAPLYVSGLLFMITCLCIFMKSASLWGFAGYMLTYAFFGIGVMGGWLFIGWALTFFEPSYTYYWGRDAVDRSGGLYPITCMIVGGIAWLFLREDARLATRGS